MTVPEVSTRVSDDTVWYALRSSLQRMPPALLAMTPPIVATSAERGVQDPAAVRGPQDRVGLTQDRSGAGPQPGAAVLDHQAGPVPPDVDEDVVGLRLPVQARSRRPGTWRARPVRAQ